jgi:hypothetical protein
MKRRTKPTTKARRIRHLDLGEGSDLQEVEVIFDAVDKVGALGAHPQAPRHLPGAYYVTAMLGNA